MAILRKHGFRSSITRMVWLPMLLILTAPLHGCKSNYHTLELRRDGDKLQRNVGIDVGALEKDDGTFEFDLYTYADIDRIAAAYGVERPEPVDGVFSFEAAFSGRLPADLNVAGWFEHAASPFGSVSAYYERFRGEDQIGADLDRRGIAYHRLLDAILAFGDTEFAHDADYPRLRDFIDATVREDLWNLLVYIWGYDHFGFSQWRAGEHSEEEHDAFGHEVIARLAGYLFEHGYADPAALPAFFAAVENEDEQEQGRLLLRGVARKMGVGDREPLPGPLRALLEDLDDLGERAEAFFEDDEALRPLAEHWTAENPEAPIEFEADSPPIIEQAVTPLFGAGGDLGELHQEYLSITLQIPAPPLFSNGRWDGEGAVIWKRDIEPSGEFGARLPDMVYAVWSEPDTEYQQRHFGGIVLEGAAIAEHLQWHTGLDRKESKQWNRFVRGLEPGPDLVPSLQRFCFRADRERCEKLQQDARAAAEKRTGVALPEGTLPDTYRGAYQPLRMILDVLLKEDDKESGPEQTPDRPEGPG